MGLFSFFKRTPPAEAGRRKSLPQDPTTVETLRTRARRRLIGAAVLVGGAVVGLPTLFDAPPRPATQDLSVRMAGQDKGSARPAPRVDTGASMPVAGVVPPLAAMPAAPVVAAAASRARRDDSIITEPKVDPKAEALAEANRKREQDKAREKEREKARERERQAEKQRLEREKEREHAKAEKARQIRLEQARAEKAREAEKAAHDAEKARARREAERSAAKADKAADKGRRYVVQVGSYSEHRAVREARQRVDKLGLETFEQHVDTSSGARTRVRLGPFASKEEAVRAAARLKSAGMNAAVLPL
jgi:DedD protein